MKKELRVYIGAKENIFQNYEKALLDAGMIPVCSENRIVANSCDALLLPGGGDVQPWRYHREIIDCRNDDQDRDHLELRLVARFARKRLPILGICRGMQVLNVAFGGTLIQDLPTGEIHAGKDCDVPHATRAEDFIAKIYGENPVVNSNHHQAVDQLGKGMVPVQWSEDGTVEAMRHANLPIVAVQWHPERTVDGEVNGRLLFDYFRDLCLGARNYGKVVERG